MFLASHDSFSIQLKKEVSSIQCEVRKKKKEEKKIFFL